MVIALVSGFLGSGKTTAIVKASQQLLRTGKTLAVITNDQGDQQVDTALIQSLGLPSGEVIDGCFCCNYSQLDQHIDFLSQTHQPDFLFAESVGSCTDLIATIAKPLLKLKPGHKVVISVFADAELILSFMQSRSSFISESIRYIYHHQLTEADVLLISKTDLLTDQQLSDIVQFINAQYGNKIVLYHSSWNEQDILMWLNVMRDFDYAKERKSLSIDYDIYAAGEAELAWLDKRIQLTSQSDNAMFITRKLIGTIFNTIQEQRLPIGHLKFFIESNGRGEKISFTSSKTSSDVNTTLSESKTVDILINARVEANPEVLHEIINSVFSSCEGAYGCKITTGKSSVFSPGYPRPTYRFS